jgi:hypothetical protein
LFKYQLLDLQLNSPFPLDHLPAPIRPSRQVYIQFIDQAPSEFETKDYPYAKHLGDRALFYWPNEAVYISSSGEQIDIFPLGEIQPKLFELSIIGPVLCSILHQQGRVPLHGSAVRKNGKTHVFLADQGMGKSTLAAFFVANGYHFLSDDIILIDSFKGSPQVFPCYPSMKLEESWIRAYDWTGEPLSLIHPLLKKSRVDLRHCFDTEPTPLSSIHFLHDAQEFKVKPSSPGEAYFQLLQCTHTAKWLAHTQQAPLHMEQCRPWILECPHLYQIDYPHRPKSLEQLLSFVENLD